MVCLCNGFNRSSILGTFLYLLGFLGFGALRSFNCVWCFYVMDDHLDFDVVLFVFYIVVVLCPCFVIGCFLVLVGYILSQSSSAI